jgi:hypothetical protein
MTCAPETIDADPVVTAKPKRPRGTPRMTCAPETIDDDPVAAKQARRARTETVANDKPAAGPVIFEQSSDSTANQSPRRTPRSSDGTEAEPPPAAVPLLLSAGMKISSSGVTPEAALMRAFCSNGHKPVRRNSRSGYMIVKCNIEPCAASCNVSSNINDRDGWYITTCTAAVNVSCVGMGGIVV